MEEREVGVKEREEGSEGEGRRKKGLNDKERRGKEWRRGSEE